MRLYASLHVRDQILPSLEQDNGCNIVRDNLDINNVGEVGDTNFHGPNLI